MKTNFKLAVFFLLYGVINFLFFCYDIENNRDICTWIWILTSIISFIGATRLFILSDFVYKHESYFIIFYTAKGDFEGYNIGNIPFYAKTGLINQNEAINHIKNHNLKYETVVINNFIEISKTQYNAFSS